jgi:2,4-dienoyl-CoA reductase-like NADH-dependent reductase (Old Yellow Enzyme family)
VSSGGLTPSQRIPVGPSYQVPLARAVKRATRMPVIAVGLYYLLGARLDQYREKVQSLQANNRLYAVRS